MAKRIDSLTEEHRATFEEWSEKWLAHGLRTGQLDEQEWATVDEAAGKVASYSSLPAPVVIHAGSPLAAMIASAVALFVAPAAARYFGVRSGVRSGVESGVRSGVESGVRSGVESGVWSGVESGVRSGLAAYQEWLHEPIRLGLQHAANQWSNSWRGGNTWAGDYAYLSWFREIGGLELAGDLWDRNRADEALACAGPQSWHRVDDLCIVAVSDRPTEIHLDRQGRSHRDDGPAIAYADGWSLNVWHGVSVPDDFFTWDTTRALAEENSEIRRCAIERIGWENVTDRLNLVAEAPDPGNAPHVIRLYDLPRDLAGMYEEPARILVVENASLDKGGHRRTFGLPVPASHEDPVAAAADLFGVPTAAYRGLVRAS